MHYFSENMDTDPRLRYILNLMEPLLRLAEQLNYHYDRVGSPTSG